MKEKAAYLKGLIDGLGIDENTKEGKVIKAMSELLSEMAEAVDSIDEDVTHAYDQINDLSERARNKRLKPEEVRGGTFTLTNHGSAGSLFATPIIFQPQAAILGTGVMQKRAVVVSDAAGNDAIAIRPMIYLSLVFDHRILDGEGADNFLKSVKDALENWTMNVA